MSGAVTEGAAGLPALAGASAPMPALAAPAPGPAWGGFRAMDLLVTAALRWRLLLLAAVIPALLGIALALLAPTRFTAQSVLLVQTQREAGGAADITGFGPNVVSVEVL